MSLTDLLRGAGYLGLCPVLLCPAQASAAGDSGRGVVLAHLPVGAAWGRGRVFSCPRLFDGRLLLVRGPGPRAKGSGPHLPASRYRTPAPRRGAVLFDERPDPRRYGHVFSKGEGSGAGGPGYRGRYFDRVRGRPAAHVEQPTQETSPVPQNTPASEENRSKLTL